MKRLLQTYLECTRTMKLLLINLIKRRLEHRCKLFKLGEGQVKRYTVLEIRSLLSIYIHEIETRCQDRFHTHAFNAIGWTLTGGYLEEQLPSINCQLPGKIVKVSGIRWIPRRLNHKLLRALPNTNTILFTGAYSHLWTEEDEVEVKLITCHQEVVGRFKKSG